MVSEGFKYLRGISRSQALKQGKWRQDKVKPTAKA